MTATSASANLEAGHREAGRSSTVADDDQDAEMRPVLSFLPDLMLSSSLTYLSGKPSPLPMLHRRLRLLR